MDNLLEIQNLSISLRQKNSPIVKGISFSIRGGQVLGIIGESGSGKSMTCRAIMSLLDMRRFTISGKVIFHEKNLLAMPDKDVQKLLGTRLAMIMQNPMTAFDPISKIGAQIVETLRIHKRVSKRDAFEIGAHELMKIGFADAYRVMNSYPHELSGGMLQRIMIALSMILSPEIIIADEATTALDVHTQAIILDEFLKMRNSGIALVIVTHNFGVLAKLADNVIVIKDGEVVEEGTVYQIFDSPQHSYTKELLNATVLRRERIHA